MSLKKINETDKTLVRLTKKKEDTTKIKNESRSLLSTPFPENKMD